MPTEEGRRPDGEEADRQRQRYSAAFEQSRDAIMLIDHRGYRDWNPASLALFAVPEGGTLDGVHPADLSPPY